MRRIQIEVHPLSALVGAGVLAVVLLGTSAVQAPERPLRVRVVGPVEIAAPAPADYVRIIEGVPYTVPMGRALVVTAIGKDGGKNSVELSVDGDSVVSSFNLNESSESVSMREIPPGLVVQGGSVVTLDAKTVATPDGRAWGYLVDA